MDVVSELAGKMSGGGSDVKEYADVLKNLCWCTGEKSKGVVIEDLFWVRPRTKEKVKPVKEYFWVTYCRQKQLDEMESRGFGHNGTVCSTRDRGIS